MYFVCQQVTTSPFESSTQPDVGVRHKFIEIPQQCYFNLSVNCVIKTYKQTNKQNNPKQKHKETDYE